MTTKTAIPRSEPSAGHDFDPWGHARLVRIALLMIDPPSFWGEILPAGRPILAGAAIEELVKEPNLSPHAMAGRELGNLRARTLSAPTEEARKNLRDLEMVVSQHISRLSELHVKLAGRRGVITELREHHQALGQLLEILR